MVMQIYIYGMDFLKFSNYFIKIGIENVKTDGNKSYS